MQRSFVKVSYTHMLKSFIKAQANCFCIRYTGPSISPCSVCPWEGNTCFGMHSPRGGRAGDTPGVDPVQLTLPPAWVQASHRLCGWWERQPACSCTTRSAPDIPLAGFSAVLASHIFILTSHGLGPFPPLPSRSLLIKKKKSLLENDVFCGRKRLKCSKKEFYELCFSTCCATSLWDFIIDDFI